MSHVDEGLLHAWIDGAFEPDDPEGTAIEAHLEACAECRASVEAAMQLKDRAAQVLRHAEPDAVRMEPFDRMIRARTARRTSAADGGDAAAPAGAATMRRRRRTHVPLAWAASIMVAVTAGWFANTMLRPDRSSGPQEAAFEPLSVQVPGPEASAESERQAGAAEADAAVADAAAVRTEEALQAPQRRAGEAADVSGAERREAATLGRTAPAAAPPPVQLKAAGAVVRESIAALVAEAEQVAAGEDRQLLESTVSGEWSPLTFAEATRRFGRAPFALEGIPIESIDVAENGTVLMLRVRQRIDADATVEIVQQSAAIALDEVVVTGLRDDTASARVRALASQANRAAARPPNEALDLMQRGDTPAVRVPVIGYTVLIRGPLPADSLRALAARIR